MNLNTFPKVSIISINFNQFDLTKEFCRSIKNLEYPNLEVIIIDNDSDVFEASSIMKINPSIKIIQSSKNLGFAGGNNLGIKEANGEYLFLVNNDVLIPDGTIETLVATFERDNSIGLVSPKIRYYDNPEIIQYAGFKKINRITGRNSSIGNLQKDIGQYDVGGYTAYGHGAAMMVKSKVISKVGYIPEFYFLYYEELDWCEKIKKENYKIYYEPKGFVLHKQSISTGKESTLKTYYITRNRVLFMRRNQSNLNFLLFLLYLVTISIPKNFIQFVISNKKDHLYSYIKALIWNIKNINQTKVY